jgi:S1-C subfamily serine protease
MFEQVCSQIRNAIYGIIGTSQIGEKQINCSNGTAFMISAGVIVTASHLVHVNLDSTQPIHSLFEVIRSPDIGQKMVKAQLIVEDPVRDIALLRIENLSSTTCVSLKPDPIPIGTGCGSLGFPLSSVTLTKTGRVFNLIERFQGAFISSLHTQIDDPSGRQLSCYETDALMYAGSSGCPGFLVNGNVFGMHIKVFLDKPKEEKGSLPTQPETRLAISLWVPSFDIITFAKNNGIAL